jgi:probable HAF family extracellular repeat protein
MRIQALFPVISATFILAGQAFAQSYTFVPIDVYCVETAAIASACPAGLAAGQVAAQTSVRGINARGDVVGFYVAGGRQHGFLLTDGQFTSLDFPIPGVRATIANGINARGEIVGQYTAPVHNSGNPPAEDSPLYCPSAADPACIKGFYYWRGQFSTVMFPATVDENGQTHHHPGAIAQRITADGDVYGCLHDHDLGPSMHGAVWTRSGVFSLLPNGGQLADAMGIPMSMNNGGTPGGQTTVGLFMDMANQQHGYVVQNGMLAPYDPPGANLTAIWDINPSQQFVGTFRYSGEPATKRHGFLQSAGSLDPITLDFACAEATGCGGAPLGTVAFATIAFGVNSAGVVVGQYALVSGGAVHGFVAIPPETN